MNIIEPQSRDCVWLSLVIEQNYTHKKLCTINHLIALNYFNRLGSFALYCRHSIWGWRARWICSIEFHWIWSINSEIKCNRTLSQFVFIQFCSIFKLIEPNHLIKFDYWTVQPITPGISYLIFLKSITIKVFKNKSTHVTRHLLFKYQQMTPET